jgi:arsenate reductase
MGVVTMTEEGCPKRTVLFICTHNAGRSQMAEGFVNKRLSDRYVAESAGTDPTALNPLAVVAMKEVGVDISSQRPKYIEELGGRRFDVVATLCSEGSCPSYPGGMRLHRSFPDPSLARGTEEQRLQAVRAIRDEIITWIRDTFR